MKNAIGSALILIALYVLSDFGAIALLRFNTFTTAIYYQIESFEHGKATLLCLYLVIIAYIFLTLKNLFSQKKLQYNDKENSMQVKLFSVGKYSYLIYFCYVSLVLFSSLIPFSVLLLWVFDINFAVIFTPLLSSISLALIAAFAATLLALPFCYFLKRKATKLPKFIDFLAILSYSLPSMIIGICFILLFNNFFPSIYDSSIPLLLALCLRFVPQAIEIIKTQMSAFPQNLESAHLSLERKPISIIHNIALPLLKPGIGTAILLVFVSSLKELPLALLLRPPGLNLLSTKIWLEANDAFYSQAAPYCIFLVLAGVSALPLIIKQKEQMK